MNTPATVEVPHEFPLHAIPDEDREALVQEAYAQLLLKSQTEPSQVLSNPRGYIVCIMRRVLRDYFRQRRGGELPVDEQGKPPELADEKAWRAAAQQKMTKAFRDLPSPGRDILLLTVRGYSETEVAKQVGLSPDTVKHHLVEAQVKIAMSLIA